MSDLITTPVNTRWKVTDGGALSLVIPYLNGDMVVAEARDATGWKHEVVMVRGVPLGPVQTERAPLEISGTAIRVDTDSAVTIEHVAYKKGTWASPTSTAASVSPSPITHYTLTRQEYDGSTWTDKDVFKYCTLVTKYSEKSPAEEIAVTFTAMPYADDWRTLTVP